MDSSSITATTSSPSGQPGLSTGQPDQTRQPAILTGQPGLDLSATLTQMNSSMSNMTTLLQQIVEEGRPFGGTRSDRRLQQQEPDSDDEGEEAEQPAKRRRGDDEHIRELVDQPDKPSEVDGEAANDDEFLKSLEAEFNEKDPIGPKVNQNLANIASKRWDITLSVEKLKPILAKHSKPENCPEISVPK